MSDVFTTRSLVHAISGSATGCWAISLFYPLNLVRTRLQLEESGTSKGAFASIREIANSEGTTALYAGLWSNVVCLGCSNFVYFYLYNGLRAALLSRKRRRGMSQVISAKLNLLISSAAGTMNVMITNPLWVASMRIMTQQRAKAMEKEHELKEFNGVLDALCKITTKDGISALWSGAGPSLILVSNPVAQFVVYEWVKKLRVRLAKRHGFPILGIEFFVMGAIAKAVATLVTYPIQLTQSRLRNARNQRNEGRSEGYTGVADCLIKTIQREGFFGLFRGMEAKLWQTVLTAAFHFFAYEKVILAFHKMILVASKHKKLN